MRASKSVAVLAGVFCSLAVASTAQSQLAGLSNNYGLSAPARTVTFSEVPGLIDYKPITNQFQPYGLTFSPNVWWAGGVVSSFDFGINLDILFGFTIKFENPIVAFAMEANAPPLTLAAYLGGKLVSEEFFPGTYPAWGTFIGLQSISSGSFDRLDVNLEFPYSWGYFDNVQFTPAPEPSTIPLVGIGVVLIGFAFARQREPN